MFSILAFTDPKASPPDIDPFRAEQGVDAVGVVLVDVSCGMRLLTSSVVFPRSLVA